MKKRFVSVPKSYAKLSDSLSETDLELRKSSNEKFGETNKKALKDRVSKPFAALKIMDEVKIDLGKNDESRPSSTQSAFKLHVIDEMSESGSGASSKMRLRELAKRQEIQRILDASKTSSKVRPKSRMPNMRNSSTQVEREVQQIFFKPFSRSEESLVDPVFNDDYQKTRKNEQATYCDQKFDSPYGSLASFKRDQFHRYLDDHHMTQKQRCFSSHDVYSKAKQTSKPNFRQKDSRQMIDDFESIRTFNSSASGKSSCFGCFVKPLANMCRRKSK